MRLALAIVLCLVATATRAADRLGFAYDAPFVNGQALITNLGTYYKVGTTSAPEGRAIIPIATVSNLPLGSLSRRVWAYLLYPWNGAGQGTLVQHGKASGAVRFFRGTNLVAEIPYRSGSAFAETTETDTNCLVAPRLFGESGYKATGQAYFGTSLAVDPTRMLVIETEFNGFACGNAIPGIDVSVDCDSARLEIDTLHFADYSTLGGMVFPGSFLTPFLAILSNPPP
jgi:hypothetical protein